MTAGSGGAAGAGIVAGLMRYACDSAGEFGAAGAGMLVGVMVCCGADTGDGIATVTARQ
ncbi:hypothetical protein [Pseudonocardia thermophila]|uniref:hypothetical protein n=1 Tax=Pseudonocardia thermophila TaxID=1848 RepID=UPI00135634F2|nr:hypothetical protein [Pseudonocardia thermophila]